MKKLLITTLLSLCASLAFAGSSCGDDKCDKKDKSQRVESSTSFACKKDKCDGDKEEFRMSGELLA